jgi:hypothetical protein
MEITVNSLQRRRPVKYKVIVDYQTSEKESVAPFFVEAGGFHTDADWIVFRKETRELAGTVVAAFPKDRVVGVIAEEE